jgi:hypothetical protein
LAEILVCSRLRNAPRRSTAFRPYSNALDMFFNRCFTWGMPLLLWLLLRGGSRLMRLMSSPKANRRLTVFRLRSNASDMFFDLYFMLGMPLLSWSLLGGGSGLRSMRSTSSLKATRRLAVFPPCSKCSHMVSLSLLLYYWPSTGRRLLLRSGTGQLLGNSTFSHPTDMRKSF